MTKAKKYLGWERRKDDPKAPWNRGRVPKAKKDTKRWCKGKEGREHVPETVESHIWAGMNKVCGPRPYTGGWWGGKWFCRHAIRCSECGKVLKTFLSEDECPDAKRD